VKIGIVGSRGFRDMGIVRAFVRSLPAGTTVVSGAGKDRRDYLPLGKWGVDEHAEDEAEKCGLQVESHPADWRKYGKRAGFVRNPLIVAGSDEINAFWDGVSNGTRSTIQIANRQRKPVRIHR
jgi:hypothetical protein